MAFVNVTENYLLPTRLTVQDNDSSPVVTLSNTTHRWGCIFMAEKTGTIDRIAFHTTSAATPADIRVSLVTVDTSGNPTSTLFGGSAAGVQSSIAPNTLYEVALGTAASVTRGDILAVLFQFDSASGSVGIGKGTGVYFGGSSFPYGRYYNGTSWTTHFQFAVNLRYSDGTYSVPMQYSGTPSSYNIFTGARRGNLFTVPFTCKITGAFFGSAGVGTSNSLVLYDGDGSTVLASRTLDNSQRGVNYLPFYNYYFDSEVTLQPSVNYRLVFNGNVFTFTMEVLNADMFKGINGDINIYDTWYTGGSWTETTTKRTFLYPVISAIDIPSGVSSQTWGTGF